MKKLHLIFFFFIFFVCNSLQAQDAPSIEWQKSLGGMYTDHAYAIKQTADHGFIISGSTDSNNGDVSGNHGFFTKDYWIVKLDSTGDLVWQKCLGGNEDDISFSIQQTFDGGYITAGCSYSNEDDVSGNHGYDDFWIVKLDANGTIQWQKCLGGSYADFANSVWQTSDGGYIIAGSVESVDGNVSGNHGALDYWVVRLDANGNIITKTCYGGGDAEYATDIQQTFDGGIIIAGYSSDNDDSSGNHGYQDYWILRLDTIGNIEWKKYFGGVGNDFCCAVLQTADGGFIAAGTSNSNDGDVSGNHGGYYGDYWIVKLDPKGKIVWQKCYGGSGDDVAHSIEKTLDGGFIVAGTTESNDGDVSEKDLYQDYWTIKLDSVGNLNWQKCMGGNGTDEAYSAQETVDGGFIIAGYTYSNSGDITDSYGNGDYWIVKLSSNVATGISSSSSATSFISVYPNPTQTHIGISLATPASEFTIRVFDLQGKIISLPTSNFKSQSSNSIELNTEILSAGFYTLQIINNKTGESDEEKFLKQ